MKKLKNYLNNIYGVTASKTECKTIQELVIDNTLQKLMNDIKKWSDATFGDDQDNPGILNHLKKEVDELIEAVEEKRIAENTSFDEGVVLMKDKKMVEEFADCFMLLLDAASHTNLTAKELIEAAEIKLEINRQREWGEPDENGVVEHIRN